jgi:hypothetical protein
MEMSKGTMLAFAVILSFVGASDAFAQEPSASACQPCYFVKAQPPHWRAHLLDIRHNNDLSAPVRTLTGVLKFGICKVENDTKLLHVITVDSITGGDPATDGWIEGKFQGRLAKDCSRAFVPLSRLLRRTR